MRHHILAITGVFCGPSAFFTKEMWRGLRLVLLLNLMNFLASAVLFLSGLGICGPYGMKGDLGGFLMPFWGLTQFVYLGPLIFFKWRKGKKDFAKGIMAGVFISLLANAATYAFMWPVLAVLAKAMDWFQYCFGLRN